VLRAVAGLQFHFREIDRLIAGILGLGIDVEQLWDYAWEMMERMVKGARGPARPGAEVPLDVGGNGEAGGGHPQVALQTCH